MAWISAYECSTAAGSTTEDFWQGLITGKDFSFLGENLKCCFFPEKNPDFSSLDILVRHLLNSWERVSSAVSPAARLGVILASTKGSIDDVIWGKVESPQDSLGMLLKKFIQLSGLQPIRSAGISNACASGLAALFLAEHWLANRFVDEVIILGADMAGPFVRQGFQSLQAVTMDRAKPFSQDRTGFYLGDAVAVILLTQARGKNQSLRLAGIGIDAEGSSLTRPSFSGQSLRKALQRTSAKALLSPQVIIAHGTATPVNDATEDRVFAEMFFLDELKPLITSTKWSVGHTLAVSGLLDVIAGCEILQHQEIFPIANTEKIDPEFRAQYLIKGSILTNKNSYDNFMVTSLGFGGLHGAARVERLI